MPDTPVFLLLHKIVINAEAGIKVSINVHLAHVVKKVKIKIIYLALAELFLKNALHFRHI